MVIGSVRGLYGRSRRGSFRDRNGRKRPFLAPLAGVAGRPPGDCQSFRDPAHRLWAHGGGAGGRTAPTARVSGRSDLYFLAARGPIRPGNGVLGGWAGGRPKFFYRMSQMSSLASNIAPILSTYHFIRSPGLYLGGAAASATGRPRAEIGQISRFGPCWQGSRHAPRGTLRAAGTLPTGCGPRVGSLAAAPR